MRRRGWCSLFTRYSSPLTEIAHIIVYILHNSTTKYGINGMVLHCYIVACVLHTIATQGSIFVEYYANLKCSDSRRGSTKCFFHSKTTFWCVSVIFFFRVVFLSKNISYLRFSNQSSCLSSRWLQMLSFNPMLITV